MTKREYDTLVSEFGRSDTDSAIKFLDNYTLKTGKHYENDYLAIITWGIKAVNERKNKSGGEFDILKSDESLEDFERIMWQKMNEET